MIKNTILFYTQIHIQTIFAQREACRGDFNAVFYALPSVFQLDWPILCIEICEKLVEAWRLSASGRGFISRMRTFFNGVCQTVHIMLDWSMK
jgi:hypothetical protein